MSTVLLRWDPHPTNVTWLSLGTFLFEPPHIYLLFDMLESVGLRPVEQKSKDPKTNNYPDPTGDTQIPLLSPSHRHNVSIRVIPGVQSWRYSFCHNPFLYVQVTDPLEWYLLLPVSDGWRGILLSSICTLLFDVMDGNPIHWTFKSESWKDCRGWKNMCKRSPLKRVKSTLKREGRN